MALRCTAPSIYGWDSDHISHVSRVSEFVEELYGKDKTRTPPSDGHRNSMNSLHRLNTLSNRFLEIPLK